MTPPLYAPKVDPPTSSSGDLARASQYGTPRAYGPKRARARVPSTAVARAEGPVVSSVVDMRSATASTVILLLVAFCGALGPTLPVFYAHTHGFEMLGAHLPSAASSRDACLKRAQALSNHATGSTHTAMLIGEFAQGAKVAATPLTYLPSGPRCLTAQSRLHLAQSGIGWAWCSLQALGSTPVGEAARRAAAVFDAYVKPVMHLADHMDGGPSFITGASGPSQPLDRRADDVRSTSVRFPLGLLLKDARCGARLLEAIARSNSDGLLDGWAERVTPSSMDEVPHDMMLSPPSFSDSALDSLPFAGVTQPLDTPWLPRVPDQPPAAQDAPACPRSAIEFFLPQGQRRLWEWFNSSYEDTVGIYQQLRAGVPHQQVTRRRAKPIALGQSEMRQWARGFVYDCRKLRSPCCVVANFSEPFDSGLNLKYIQRRLKGYPDQALLSHLLDGVRLDADVELQTVLVPHLMSITKGFMAVAKELKRMQELGWYGVFHDMPFVPGYFNAQGSTPRKFEQDRDRRTTEGGGPRQRTTDMSGLPAISINDASRTHHMPRHYQHDVRPIFRDWLAARGLPRPASEPPLRATESKWPKEIKPLLIQVLRDLAILRRAAEVLSEPIYVASDDIADFFSQLGLSTPTLPLMNIHFISLDDMLAAAGEQPQRPKPVFVQEKRLGFGTHGASNVAQRFSDAILHLFREDFDALEARQPMPNSAAQRYWKQSRLAAYHRRLKAEAAPQGRAMPTSTWASYRQAHEERLCSIHCFTDDMILACVGAERMVRALRTWRNITTDLNLVMAKPEKRHLGQWLVWLGVIIFVQVGVAVIPRSKIVRASSTIERVLCHQATFAEYRSLCGLLEHLRAICLKGRNHMFGLYEPHASQEVARHGPDARIACSVLMRKQLQRWQETLAHAGCVSIRRAVLRDEISPKRAITIALCSDACLGDEDPAGIAGFCHGMYWYLRIPSQHIPLVNIVMLEFLAVCGNFFVFHSYLSPLLKRGAMAVFRTDALTTAYSLPRESQKSAGLMHAYSLLKDSEEFKQLRAYSRCMHLHGSSNSFSDLASRARWTDFHALCAQIRISPTELPIPDAFMQLYREVVAEAARSKCATTRPRAGGSSTAHAVPTTTPHDPSTTATPTTWALSARARNRLAHAYNGNLNASGRGRSNAPAAAATASTPSATSSPATPSLLDRLRGEAPPPGQHATVSQVSAPPTPGGHRRELRLPAAPETRADGLSDALSRASSKFAESSSIRFTQAGEPSMRLTGDPSELARAAQVVDSYSTHGVNAGTAAKDNRAFTLWEKVCEHFGTSPTRTAQDAKENPERNAFLLVSLMLYARMHCQPRQSSEGKFIKPRSCLAYALAIIRIHKRWGVHLPGYKQLAACLQGMCRAYVRHHGPGSLTVHKAEPMKFTMAHAIFNIPEGTIVDGMVWSDDNPAVFTFRRANLFAMYSGARLAAISLGIALEVTIITRDCVSCFINNMVHTNPSEEVLRSMKSGDVLTMRKARAKCDQWLEVHGHAPYAFTYEDEPFNVAKAIRDILLRYPLADKDRSEWALFSNERGEPFSHSFYSSMLRRVLSHLYGQSVARLYTWHSYRSGCATALHAAGVPDEVIMLLLDWVSPDSLRSYRRPTYPEQHALLKRAAGVPVNLLQPRNAPVVSGDQHYAAMLGELSSARGADRDGQDGVQLRTELPSEAAERRSALCAPHASFAHSTSNAARKRGATNADEATGDARQAGATKISSKPPDVAPPAGARVLVMRSAWPAYACEEHEGQGWEATVRSATGRTAMVSFTRARTVDGRRYEDTRIPLTLLRLCEEDQGAQAATETPARHLQRRLRGGLNQTPRSTQPSTCALCKCDLEPRQPSCLGVPLPTREPTPLRLQCVRCRRVNYCSARCAHIHYFACHRFLCPLPSFSVHFTAEYVECEAGYTTVIPIRCIDHLDQDVNADPDVCARVYAWTGAPHMPYRPKASECLWCLREVSGVGNDSYDENQALHNIYFVALITRIRAATQRIEPKNFQWQLLPRWRAPLAVYDDVPQRLGDPTKTWPAVSALARYCMPPPARAQTRARSSNSALADRADAPSPGEPEEADVGVGAGTGADGL